MDLKIGNVKLNGNLIQAPMAGYGDVAFRRLCKDYGASLTVSEMISVKGLLYEGKKTIEMLRIAENEGPVSVQLFGNDPKEFEKAIKTCKTIDNFDIIDINMGCPVPKVTKNGDGSALMKNVGLASDIVKACKGSTDKPVTVKCRLGWDSNISEQFTLAMEKAGADMIAVHGRTAVQGYRGESDTVSVLRLKNVLSVPLVCSGDVRENNLDSYRGADGLMIGRGALGHPDIFKNIADILSENGKHDESVEEIAKNNSKTIEKTIEKADPDLVYSQILKQIEYMQYYFDSEHYVVANMRKHLAYYLHRVGISGNVKNRIITAPTIDDVKGVLKEAFDK